jgi:RNA polymerase sigma-70 factor (ECF subfamily)
MALLAAIAAIEEPGRRPGALAREEEQAGFEALMRQYERLVLVTALRIAGNMEDAKDISQEVFLRLYRNLDKVRSMDNLTGWLYRVTVNACFDLRRRRPALVPVELADDLASSAIDPQQAASDGERRRALEMSLRILSEKERAAVVLRDLEGLSTEETAAALGSSPATVRSQISKARVKLKSFMESYCRRRI